MDCVVTPLKTLMGFSVHLNVQLKFYNLPNHKKVLVLMRELQLLSTAFNKRTRKYNSYRGNVGTVAKNLINRRFFTDRPYQKLVTDVTEVRWGTKTIDERAYFTCIYDLFSGEILSHQVSKHPTVEFTTTVLNRAVKKIPKNLKYRTTVPQIKDFNTSIKIGLIS
ncbi:hypothetical protein A4W79_04005 [Latilactobacillus curvatus]|nr:hypothetical protein A4W79_04005 [Latilactobacillus curvatus]